MNNSERLGLIVGGLLVTLGVTRIANDVVRERNEIRLARVAAGEALYQRRSKTKSVKSISVD